jgi:acetoin utilization deacetylase AcuC-like enzyme
VNRVAIIDCDVHYGNGTDDIIGHLKIDWIRHHTLGQHFHDRDGVGKDAKLFLTWLYKAIDDCQDADLVIYQAGADPHIDDPLGGVLTEVEMVQRDHAVFSSFRGRPLVWNLAGGYQRDADGGIKPVLKLHRNTLSALQAVDLGHP